MRSVSHVRLGHASTKQNAEYELDGDWIRSNNIASTSSCLMAFDTMLERRRLWKGLSQNKREAVSRTNATMAKMEVKGQYLTVAATVYSMSGCSLTRSLTKQQKAARHELSNPGTPN